jgi:gas vesicle protein
MAKFYQMEVEQMYERGSGVGMLFLGILAGAVVGGVTALLLAPKSGQETRQMIKDKSMEWRDMAQDRYADMRERMNRAGECLRTTSEQGKTGGNGL